MKRDDKSLLFSFVDHNKVVRQNLITLIKCIVEHEADVIVLSEEINGPDIIKFYIHVHNDDKQLIIEHEKQIEKSLGFYSSRYGTYYFYEMEYL